MKHIVLALVAALGLASSVQAADLGGNCCADLEERVAELEATTARKGNKKVSLTVSGEINKTLLNYDGSISQGDEKATFDGNVIGSNFATESFVNFSGKAAIMAGYEVGFVLQIGQGSIGIGPNDEDGRDIVLFSDNELYTRQSFVFFSTPVGKLGLGLQNLATWDVANVTLGNTNVVSRQLTLQPINTIGGFLGTESFNGIRDNAVRYDSPVFAGFSLSASWASASDAKDVALRFAQEVVGFRVAAGVGYIVQDNDNVLGVIPDLFFDGVTVESKKLLASGAIQHIDTGLFVNGSYGKADYDLFEDGVRLGGASDEAWAIQAGIERKVLDLGATSVFFEIGQQDSSLLAVFTDSESAEVKYWGLGLVQNLGGFTDLYVAYRDYEAKATDGEDAIGADLQTIMGGARIKF